MLLTSDHILEDLTFNAGQNSSSNPEQELLITLTQNYETIQNNFVTINNVIQFLNNYLVEIIYNNFKNIILYYPYDKARLVIIEANNDNNI